MAWYPEGLEKMTGVDISHYQKGLTIRQIRDAGNAFAIIKLTEGDFLVDNAAFGFYHEAYELGFPVGCYCYSHAAAPEQARREAEFLLKTLNGFPMPCGIFLDVEEPKQLELSNDKLAAVVDAWCAAIFEAGYVPGVYGSEFNLWAKLSPDELPEGALVWAAHYGREPEMACDLWQSSDSGSIPGSSGRVDTDEARSERFMALVSRALPQPPPPKEELAHHTPPEADPVVMQLQACLRYAGCWPEEIDGLCSETFCERLCGYARSKRA